jgi:hypothetical protein
MAANTHSTQSTRRLTGREWLYLYAGMAVLTLIFQIWVRSSQCAGLQECGLSFAKAVVWSVIWPISWVVYLAGFL